MISAAHKKKNTNRFLEFLRQCVIPLTPLLDALVNVAMHGADRTNNLTFASLAITNQIITSISSNVWHNSLFNFRLCMLIFLPKALLVGYTSLFPHSIAIVASQLF